jgi:transposase InsO family protein
MGMTIAESNGSDAAQWALHRRWHLFANLREAQAIIEEWRIDYNTNRPHTSLNGLTPTEFAARPKQGQNLL